MSLCSVIGFTWNWRSSSALIAASLVSPATFGIFTVSPPEDTEIVTVVPGRLELALLGVLREHLALRAGVRLADAPPP